MDVFQVLIILPLLLFTARLFGELAARCNIPPVIGELVAGLILGPSCFGLLTMNESIQIFAEIGIILLLFEVGMESDLSRLAKTASKPLIVALGGVLLPFVFGFWISYFLFSLSLLASLFIASTLTATSIGITMRVLRDLNQDKSEASQIVLGAAVIDDIIGIILLSVIYEFAKGEGVDFTKLSFSIVSIIVFLCAAPFTIRWIAKGLAYADLKSKLPGFKTVSALCLIFFFSSAAHAIGAPALLGGFAAGLALSSKFPIKKMGFSLPHPFSEAIEKGVESISYLFTPIFFVAIGIALNLKEVPWSEPKVLLLASALLIAAILGKLLSGFFLWKEPKAVKWAVGLAMIPRGEVGLIFAEVGNNAKIFDNELYAVMVIVIAVTTLLAPLLLKRHFHRPLE